MFPLVLVFSLQLTSACAFITIHSCLCFHNSFMLVFSYTHGSLVLVLSSQLIRARVFITTLVLVLSSQLTRARVFITTHSCSCFIHTRHSCACFITTHSCSCFHHHSLVLVQKNHNTTHSCSCFHHNSLVLVFSSQLTSGRVFITIHVSTNACFQSLCFHHSSLFDLSFLHVSSLFIITLIFINDSCFNRCMFSFFMFSSLFTF
eukprot:Pompholyxophrys_punicea_v1_NODE_593_length_1626_cov_24.699936.p1 type:complete len:204 gc:universal NODE_593_length_1626_cov_24.699936:285-896(+)